MRTRIANPRILVLGSSMQFQQTPHSGYAKEQDATALLKAEEEWGIKCVERIMRVADGHPPDIVVCEGQVSTQVQRLLGEKTNHNVTLLFNIKRSVITRLAKCINAEVMPSTNVMMTLGTCDQFYIENHEYHATPRRNSVDSPSPREDHRATTGRARQAFAFFVWSPEKKQTYGAFAHLGVTLTLRGETYERLVKIKKMVKHLLRTAFNLQLEAHVLANEGAKAEAASKDAHAALSMSPHIQRFAAPKIAARVAEPTEFLEAVYNQRFLFGSCTWSSRNQLEPDKYRQKEPRFYSEDDMNLGYFLTYKCFGPNPQEQSSPKHTVPASMQMVQAGNRFKYQYTHDKGCVSVTVGKLSSTVVSAVAYASGTDIEHQQIYMWSLCKECGMVHRPVPMSEGTKQYSFSKYLELLFHNSTTPHASCGHSVHHSHVHFFARGDMVVRVEYDKPDVFDVVFPEMFKDEDEDILHTPPEASTPPEPATAVENPPGEAESGEHEDISERVATTPIAFEDAEGSMEARGEAAERREATAETASEKADAEARAGPPLDTDVGKILALSVIHAQNRLNSNSTADGDDGMLYPVDSGKNDSGRNSPPGSKQGSMRGANTTALRDSLRQSFIEAEDDPRLSSMTSLARASLLERSSMVPEDFLHKTDSVVNNMQVVTAAGEAESTMCTVFFPYMFERLRETLETDGNRKFVDSLMHSKPALLTGGKVGDFFKSDDDRFIIKMIKKVEAESFGKHAKDYIDFIYQRAYVSDECPSALVKILGFFRIRHTHKMRSQYIIVMENLFPRERMGRIERVFDLKGCTYGRRQKEEGATGFERNLMEYTGGSPLLLTPIAKAKFDLAIRQDTAFLQQLQVVDYSLLIGVNTTTKQLVVGIVDYCREFSFGLRLYGGVTGGRTIVAPKDYRTRFCKQMDRFLMHVPSFDDEPGMGDVPSDGLAMSMHTVEEDED